MMTNKIVQILKSRLLTPIIYILDEDIISVIGFFDGNTKVNYIYETQSLIEKAIGREINLCDIRDFNEADRLDIIRNAKLIYSENPFVKSLFESAMAQDFSIAQSKRKDVLDRYRQKGTLYLS